MAGPNWGSGAEYARSQRTQNMPYMVVTLDVSRLSGWLNAFASLNIWLMSVTPEVSQPDMSALKSGKS